MTTRSELLATRQRIHHQDCVLHYVSKSGLRQWITEPEQQSKIIEACQTYKLGGHFGREKTSEKIGSRFVIITVNCVLSPILIPCRH